ncbi:MAG: metallophosphoesterase [Phenylobacterium sp.]
MIYFTADLHFFDNRMDLFMRPFLNAEDNTQHLIKAWNSIIKDNDDVYVLGDFIVADKDTQEQQEKKLANICNKLNGKKHLILGNYDTLPKEIYLKYFASCSQKLVIKASKSGKQYKFLLTHKPEDYQDNCDYILCGHIHGLWKVQRKMINVGCDAWHFKPIDIEQILFVINAIENHYDINVFAGEIKINRLA